MATRIPEALCGKERRVERQGFWPPRPPARANIVLPRPNECRLMIQKTEMPAFAVWESTGRLAIKVRV